MNKRVTEKRPLANLDKDNHRFVIRPLKDDGLMDVPSIFRAIKNSTTTTWRDLREFAGLKSSSDTFKVAYTGGFCARVTPHLNDFMVIDSENDVAYFYDSLHRPAGVLPKHVRPMITNKEDSLQYITAKVPAKVTSRVVVTDLLDRVLQLSVAAEGGYVLGLNDVNLCTPGATYVVTGSVAALNQLLRQMHFVGMDAGDGTLIITVDDMEDDVASKSSTTIDLKIAAGEVISVPSLLLPKVSSVELNKFTVFEPIEVADPDGKMLEFRITPFGCTLVGFKTYLAPIGYGEVRTVYGRPETINAELANLKVMALQENAQVGMELICGSTKLRQYLAFNVISTTETPPAEDTQETVNDTPPAAPTGTVTVTTAESAFTGTIGEPELVAVAFGGDRTTSFDITITPHNCSVTGFNPESGTVTAAHTFTGTAAQLSSMFSALEVTPTADQGSIVIDFPGANGAPATHTITFTATAATPA